MNTCFGFLPPETSCYGTLAGKAVIPPAHSPVSQMPVPREGPASPTATRAAPAHQGEAARRKKKHLGSHMDELMTHGRTEPAPATHRGLFEIQLLQKENS